MRETIPILIKHNKNDNPWLFHHPMDNKTHYSFYGHSLNNTNDGDIIYTLRSGNLLFNHTGIFRTLDDYLSKYSLMKRKMVYSGGVYPSRINYNENYLAKKYLCRMPFDMFFTHNPYRPYIDIPSISFPSNTVMKMSSNTGDLNFNIIGELNYAYDYLFSELMLPIIFVFASQLYRLPIYGKFIYDTKTSKLSVYNFKVSSLISKYKHIVVSDLRLNLLPFINMLLGTLETIKDSIYFKVKVSYHYNFVYFKFDIHGNGMYNDLDFLVNPWNLNKIYWSLFNFSLQPRMVIFDHNQCAHILKCFDKLQFVTNDPPISCINDISYQSNQRKKDYLNNFFIPDAIKNWISFENKEC